MSNRVIQKRFLKLERGNKQRASSLSNNGSCFDQQEFKKESSKQYKQYRSKGKDRHERVKQVLIRTQHRISQLDDEVIKQQQMIQKYQRKMQKASASLFKQSKGQYIKCHSESLKQLNIERSFAQVFYQTRINLNTDFAENTVQFIDRTFNMIIHYLIIKLRLSYPFYYFSNNKQNRDSIKTHKSIYLYQSFNQTLANIKDIKLEANMNQLSLKLQEGMQLFKQNQKFKQVIGSNPTTLPVSSTKSIAVASLNTDNVKSVLPNINNMKVTLRDRPKSQVRIRRSETVANLSKRKQQQKDQLTGNINNRQNRFHYRQRRILNRQNVKSTKNLKAKNQDKQQPNGINLNVIASQKNIHVTPTKNTINFETQNSTNVKQHNGKSKTVLMQNLIKQINEQIILNVKFNTLQQNGSYKGFIHFFKNKETGQTTEVQHTLALIKKFIKRYQIQSGMIQGKQLGKLVKRSVLSNHQIVDTFINKSEIVKNHQIHGLTYYEDFNSKKRTKGQNLAACRIVSLFKMIVDRNYAKKLRSLMKKVRIIQAIWRSCLIGKRGRRKILDSISLKLIKAQKLTQMLIQNWQIIKTSPRVQIHIASYCMQQFKRLTLSDFQHRQNCQITRIFRAIESDVTVIYVSPVTLDQEIMKYYDKIFATNHVSIKGKLYVICPQNISRLPQSLTTVSALLYSPKAIKRIKSLLQSLDGGKNSYIVPSFPSVQFTNLSSVLEVPLFSKSPNKYKLFSNKSFFRSILQRASIPTLKSLHSIYSQKQMINSLAILIYKNPNVKKWYLKIDDQIRARGIAIVNCQAFPFFKRVRGINEDENIQQQLSDKQMIRLIADQLNMKLKKKLRIMNKEVYRNYDDFVAHFSTRGGVIQAEATGKTVQYSISFLIQPNGQFKVIGTYHKLELGGKTIQGGIKSPASIIYKNQQQSKTQSKNRGIVSQYDYLSTSNQIQKIIRNLYKQIYIHLKMFGYFSIDLLHQQSTKTTYGIGFDCFLNQQTSSLFAIQFCSQSYYDRDLNSIIKKKKQPLKLQTQTSADTIQQPQRQANQKLHLIYCPIIKIPNLPHISIFFKKCKFGNISFDLTDKLGIMFYLLDNLESGVVGMMCVQKSEQLLYSSIQRTADYLNQQFVYKKIDSRNKKHDQLGVLKGMAIVMGRKGKKKQQKIEPNLQSFF